MAKDMRSNTLHFLGAVVTTIEMDTLWAETPAALQKNCSRPEEKDGKNDTCSWKRQNDWANMGKVAREN